MKRFFSLILFIYLLFISSLFSIGQEIVNWKVNFNKNENTIEIKATIKEGWHLYSQHLKENIGPIPTTFSFQSSSDFQLIGKVIEPQPIQKYDAVFESNLEFFEKEVTFIQKIRAIKPTQLEGTISFMVCSETMCLPPTDYKYKIEINI